MPVKLETAVRRGDVSSVLELIAKFSHATYAKLPMHYQSVWTVDELMAHGIGHSVVYVAKKYKPAKMKKAKLKYGKNAFKKDSNESFITYLHVALDHLYKDLISEAYADKRKVAVFSLDTEIVGYKAKSQVSLYECLVRGHRNTKTEEENITRIDAERAFLQVYSTSTPRLRKYLINWCIQPKITKYKLSGKQFRLAIAEFKDQGYHKLLTADLIRTIQNDALCRNRVALAVLRRHHTLVREGQPFLENKMLAEVVV